VNLNFGKAGMFKATLFGGDPIYRAGLLDGGMDWGAAPAGSSFKSWRMYSN
jgi:hypothetical protein